MFLCVHREKSSKYPWRRFCSERANFQDQPEKINKANWNQIRWNGIEWKSLSSTVGSAKKLEGRQARLWSHFCVCETLHPSVFAFCVHEYPRLDQYFCIHSPCFSRLQAFPSQIFASNKDWWKKKTKQNRKKDWNPKWIELKEFDHETVIYFFLKVFCMITITRWNKKIVFFVKCRL